MDAIATRHERVIVSLDDQFTSQAARMAAATSKFRTNVDDAGRSTVVFDKTVRDTGPSIDKLSGRLGILARAFGALGPGLVPITTAIVPAVSALATQLGFAAAGAGTAVLAFNGVGDALEALNDFQLEPTAENLAKLQEEMKGLGPAAREFVFYLDEIGPQLQSIRQTAQEGLLPGVQEGIDALLERLPEVRGIVAQIATTSGDLFSAAGAELASSEWDDFFRFLESEAQPALVTLGQTAGNVAKGIAELWMAMDPLSDDFAEGLLKASEAFESWAEGVSKTQGFREFLAYVRETGPQVLETVGSLANMLLQIGEAAAPLGGPVLKAIEAVADALAAIADSPIGPTLMTAVTAMSALSLASNGLHRVLDAQLLTTFRDFRREGKGVAASAGGAAKSFRGLGAATAGLVGLSFIPGIFDDIHRSMDETLPGVQKLTGQLMALGDGRLAALGSEFYNVAESIRRITDRTTDETINDALQVPFEGLVGEAGTLREARAEIDRLDEALAQMVGLVGSAKTRAAFREFAQNQGLGAEQTKTLLNLLPGYREALAGAANATNAQGEAAKGASGSLKGLRGEIEDTTTVAEDLRTALDALITPTLNQSAATDQWVVALRDMRKAIKEANGDLLSNSKAAIAARDGMRGYVQAALDKAQADAEATGSGRQMAATLIETRDHIVAQAKAAGLSAGEIRNLVKQMGLTPKNLRTVIETPGVLKAHERVRALGKLYDLTPKQIRTLIAQPGMGASQAEIKKLMRDYDLTPKQVRTLLKAVNQASGTLAAHRAAIAAIPRNVNTTLTVTRIRGQAIPGIADGGEVMGQRHPYGDKVHALLAPGEEVITNRHGEADRFRADRAAGRIPAYAEGGTVQRFANGGSVDRSEILRLRQEIRDLMKELAAEGKKAISGLERRRTQAELREARRDLRDTRTAPRREMLEGLQGALGGFGVADILGRGDPRNPTQAGIRTEVNEFRKAIREAGGAWTKRMDRLGDAMIRNARKIDVQERAIERETAKRDRLVEGLGEFQSQMDSLRSTMAQFSAGVAGNFLTDPFNQSRTVTIPGRVDPGTQRRLSEAEARLIALRSGPNADSMASVAEQSRLLPQIQALRAEVERQSQPVEQVISGHQMLTETLKAEAESARDFLAALQELRGRGLSNDVLSSLATSGDLGTAQQLVAGGQSAVQDINRLWNERAAAAAEVAAFATQEVYGQQQAILQSHLDRQADLVRKSNDRLENLGNRVDKLGDRIVAAEERSARALAGAMANIREAIKDQPRENQERDRQGRGRG